MLLAMKDLQFETRYICEFGNFNIQITSNDDSTYRLSIKEHDDSFATDNRTFDSFTEAADKARELIENRLSNYQLMKLYFERIDK